MRCYPKIQGIYTARPNLLPYALPPLDVASSMLCESVCQQLSNWEDMLLSSVWFVRLCFSDLVIFYNWYDGVQNLQQILFTSLKTAVETHWMLEEVFGDNAQEPKQNYFMVQMLHRRTNVCQQQWAFWMTVDKHNTRKHNKSSRGYPCRSWANYPRCLWDSRTVIRDRSTHFGGQFEHETRLSKICAKTAGRRQEGPSCFCLQGTQTSQRRPQLHLQYHNRWRNMGVWQWPWH
jgi:hypothetical protein